MASLNLHDLTFVLKQIKIGEAHANGAALTEIRINPLTGEVITDGAMYDDDGIFTGDATFPRAIPDAKTPFGIRTVDGSYNNLMEGRELWGAADQTMPRFFDANYADGGPEAPFNSITNTNYGNAGNVVDSDPRTISNLVVDMSLNNPAAIFSALVFAGSEDPYADLAELLAVRATTGTSVTDAQAALDVAEAAFQAAAALFNPADSATWDAIQTTAAALTVAEEALAAAQANNANPEAAFVALANEKGILDVAGDLIIPNVAPDEGISAPFNAWMTFFGQFFDHGLDLITKGNNGTIYVPLKDDDPLVTGADGILGDDPDTVANEALDDLPAQLRFMVLTRATPTMVDGVAEHTNTTTPFVDQNQTYTSHASHQVFLREYAMVLDADYGFEVPKATGRLLEGEFGGLATWADVKEQAATVLGIALDDRDVLNVPLLRTDAYGEFIRGPNGLPLIVTGLGTDGIPNTADDVVMEGNLTTPVATWDSAVKTAHAFLDDIAHNAAPQFVDPDRNPGTINSVWTTADGDGDTGNSVLVNALGVRLEYDNELLDRHFITGDGRGNENFGLTAVHHVFHSEHNRQTVIQKMVILEEGSLSFVNEWLTTDLADQAALDALRANMDAAVDKHAFIEGLALNWDGERIFQAARFATEMQYQHLVFEEFGRKIQPAIDPFVFNSVTDINPAIFAEFANVVYRFGHSMLTESMPRSFLSVLNTPSEDFLATVDEGLIAAFLNPVDYDLDGLITHEQAAGAVVRGLTNVRGNAIDEFVVDALRNNLLGLPLDLAAINIARGRDTGMPTLNQAREQLFSATGQSFLKPYGNWTEFAVGLKNPISVVNFIAAYGTHSMLTAATTLEAKRDIAWELVFGVEVDGVTPSDILDRLAFINGTGIYAANKGGLDNVDLWIGGLAEKILLFGGMLGSTFSAVFEAQMEALQDADRFYYLTRTQGLNFLDGLENNAFSKMIMANTDLTEPGPDGIRGTEDDVIKHHIGIDSFGKYDLILEADIQYQQDYNGADPGKDPNDIDAVLASLGLTQVNRALPPEFAGYYNTYLRYIGGEHVVLGGTSGNDVLIGDLGDDGIWGDAGNDYIEGGQGVDLIMGGYGDDIILDEGDEGDFIKGDEGNDVIASSNGLDVLMGGGGKDVVFAGKDDTEVFGGEGDDFIMGGDGVDFLLGNEGDDWMEAGGGFDTTAGDNSELFFNSTILGHDVMFAGSEEHDFDAESGDDIMVQGESVMRNEGMFGFDWVSYQGATFDADADMRIRIFTTEEADILRNRFDKVEALSGGDGNDTLRGDDRADGDAPAIPTTNNTETLFFNDELSEAGLGRIEGLRALLGNLVAGVPVSDSELAVAFTGGNILLGGAGSDMLQGNGGDDFIDGNARLNVRIRLTAPDAANTAANELGTIYTLKHVFTAAELTGLNLDPTLAGKSLFELLIVRAIVPSQMHIVREIIADDGSASDIDTAVFNGNLQNADGSFNYTITSNNDGTITVAHVNVPTEVDPVTGRQLISDGVDTVRNIERLQFRDQTIELTPPELFLNTGGEYTDAFNNNSFGNSDGVTGWGPDWVEFGDSGGVTSGQIQIDPGGQGNNVMRLSGTGTGGGNPNDGAMITRTMDLSAADTASIRYTITESGLEAGEWVRVFFAADGVNFLQINEITAAHPNSQTHIHDLTGPFAANAAIRFQVSAMTSNDDIVTVNDLSISFASEPSMNNTTTFTEGDGPDIGADVAIASKPLIVENDQIVSARVVLTNPQPGDSFDVPVDLPGNITRTVATVGGQIVVTLTGNEPSLANWQAALQAVEFRNNSQAPSETPRVIQVTVNDGFLNSNVATTTVNVVSVNDAPDAVTDNVITNIAGPIFIPEWIMLRNDTDLDGPSLSVTGAAEDDANFTAVYDGVTRGVTATRSDGDNTKDFTYTLSDGIATDTADVDITWDTVGTVSGGGGADIILGDGGNSTFAGNGGDDLIIAGGGNDNIDGGAGNDEIHWNVGHGRDFVNGGANVDTFVVNGDASSENYFVMSRAVALAAGLTIDGATEIVITRNAIDNASILAELDNIEEIIINTGEGTDQVIPIGTFAGTSLLPNTITVNGGSGNDTVDISGLQSAHRIVFRSNGGNDTIVGNLRPQDVIELAPGESVSGYALVNNGNGTHTYSNGTHSVTFTGAVPPQFQNGPVTGGTQLDEEDFEDLLDMVRDPDFDRDSSGTGNNVANPGWGAAGQQFIRLTEAHYTDGEAGIRQTALTPREISNILSSQDNDGNGIEESIVNAFGGTSLLTFFGQYFDHGLDFVAKGEPGSVYIGDVGSTPVNAPRSNIVPGTGVDGIPAEYINNTSPYVDQNQAYGSHNAVTDLLRRWEVGTGGEAVQTAYLLTGDMDASGHAMLPTLSHIRDNYRVMTGGNELTSEDIGNYDGTGNALLIDFIPKFVLLEDGVTETDQLDLDQIGHYFVSGDGRANENVMLTSIHTIWARNHNFWVNEIKANTNNEWTESEYFEAARMMNIAEYQRVVFTEFTTAMAGGFDNEDLEHGFEGYDATVDASISVEFSQAAYRFGHSMLNETVSYVDDNGVLQEISLVQAFLSPNKLSELGIDALISGAVQVQHQAIDEDVVNALRNQLVGRPLDLAALNIFRGRDMGVAPFNSIRTQLYEQTNLSALRPYTGWADFALRNGISAEMLAKLQMAYPDGFESMDLWIGGLLEKPMAGQLGSTFGYIFLEQLHRLQHGDRLYYLEIFDDSLFRDEGNVTFADIIERNTGLTGLPENVFDIDGSNAPADDDEHILTNVDEEDDDTAGQDDDDDEDDDDTVGQDDDDEDDDDTVGQDDDDDEDDDEDDDDEDDDDSDDDDDDDDDGAPAPGQTGHVVGTPQDDMLFGNSGGDLVFGFAGTDHIIAGGGADVVRAGSGNDFVDGGAGRDVLFGEDGDDDMFGGDDDDMVYGGAGDDRMFGGDGNDLLDAGDGDDAVFGGNGNDMIVASLNDGNDNYYGGDISGDTGNDTLDMGFLTVDAVVDLGTGVGGRGSAVSSQSGTDTLWGIENVVTGSGNDTIVMSNAVNIVDGGLGDDVFVFGSATAAHGDTIRGFETGDKIDLSGIDANTGTAGNDTFVLESGQATTAPGQIVVTHETREDGEYTVVVGNTSGDNAPEFRINIAGNHALTADDFNL